MKKIVFTLTSILATVQLFAQINYEPQILILSPNNVEYSKIFEKEIGGLNESIKKNSKYQEQVKSLTSSEFAKQPENIQAMMKSEVEFSKNIDFVKQTSAISEQYLAYRFFEKFPNVLVKLKDIKSEGKLDDLKKISEENNLQYVLNFPNLSFYKENDISYAKLAVQFYDHATNILLIDTTYVGNWDNPGFEFACETGSLGCTINNSISQALDNVIYTVAKNSPTLRKERELARQRFEALRNDYYIKPFDRTFIANVIKPEDSTVLLDNLYQLLISEDKTKFVGFFLNKKDKQNFKQLNESKQDQDVKIMSDKNIKDTGYLDDIPQTYAYIVKAVKYNNKWYYEKAEATYFKPNDNEGGRLEYFNNLQDWGFFTENTTTFNTDFWETNLFKKIKDLRKDPDWDKYGETIWKTEEEENRPYIGFYEIVAEQLKNKPTNEPKRITIN